jgi:casein kinase II subunit alpha
MSDSGVVLHASPRETDFSEPTVIGGRYNPDHPLISSIYANVNLEAGPAHWSFHKWNPTFGTISRYRISRYLGSGRYSDVFVGHCNGHADLAVKILKPIINQSKIRREAKTLTIVQGHRNVLRLQDVLIDPSTSLVSFVTELVAVVGWKELIATMKLDDIRFYFYSLLKGIDHTHSRGIMHRDIKPGNILCEHPQGVVKIADWGLAEFYHPLRKYQGLIGTLRYEAPELLVDFGYYHYSVDIWSAGCMLLGALCGKKCVFHGDSADGVLRMIAEMNGGRKMAKWMRKYKMGLMPETIQAFEAIPGVGFEPLFPASRRQFQDTDALDLARKMLKIDHNKRITASQALQHPFFAIVREREGTDR